MKTVRESRMISGVALCLECRPWILAVVYLLSELLTYLTLVVLFMNHCPSVLSFVPEMSDEFAAAVCDVYDFSLKLTVVVGGIMLLAPLIPLVYRRYRTVVIMLVWGVAVMVVGTYALDLVPWSCRSALAEQMRVVRLNLERKEAAAREGRKEYLRTPVHKFVQRLWTFCKGRYEIYQPDNTIEKDVYFLLDKRWRQDRYRKDMWENRVLLDDVVQWNDCKDHLYVVTKVGKRYVLDYASGNLSPFAPGGCK